MKLSELFPFNRLILNKREKIIIPLNGLSVIESKGKSHGKQKEKTRIGNISQSKYSKNKKERISKKVKV